MLMKTDEIKVGRMYTNGKGRFRVVLEIGPEKVVFHPTRMSKGHLVHDRIGCDLASGTESGFNQARHTTGSCSLQHLARWAKEEIPSGNAAGAKERLLLHLTRPDFGQPTGSPVWTRLPEREAEVVRQEPGETVWVLHVPDCKSAAWGFQEENAERALDLAIEKAMGR